MGALLFSVKQLDLKRRQEAGHKLDHEEQDKSEFWDANYYLLKNHEPAFTLKADYLSMIGNQFIDFTNPKGEAISEEKLPIYYEAKIGKANKVKDIFDLYQDVKITYKNMELKSQEASYDKKADRFDAIHDVVSTSISEKTLDKIIIYADQAVAWPHRNFARYTGRVHGDLIRKKAYEGGMSFKSNILEADMNSNVVTLTEDVFLKKQDLNATSLRAEIFLENYNKKLKYYVLYDDVKLEQKLIQADGTTLIRKGFCEKLEGYVTTEEAVMTGSPKLLQGKDVVTGNKITLKEHAQLVEVDDNKSSLTVQKAL